MNIRKLYPPNIYPSPAPSPDPEPAPPAPATPPPAAPVYVLGLNPCPWEIVDHQKHLVKCKVHGVMLDRKQFPKRNGKGFVTRYDCPVKCPGDPVNRNDRGFCKTGAASWEIFEDPK